MTGFNVKLDSSAIEVNNTIDRVFANTTDGEAGALPKTKSIFYNYAEKNSVALIREYSFPNRLIFIFNRSNKGGY